MTVLTNTQAAFAAENHALIYKFLNQRHLPESEYYDTVVFAFLECVSENTATGFENRTFTAMEKAVEQVQSAGKPVILSLCDYADAVRTIEDTLFDPKDEIAELLERIQEEALIAYFNTTEQEILRLLLQGFGLEEVSLRLKQSVSQMNAAVNQIKAKAGAMLLPVAA